jgi:hypothetical protein
MSDSTTITGRFIGGAIDDVRLRRKNARKYNALFTLKDDNQLAKVNAIVDFVKREKWGDKPPRDLQIWAAMEGDDPEMSHTYEQWFINPKCNAGEDYKAPPIYRKRRGEKSFDPMDADEFYPGCFGACAINAYAYDGSKEAGIKPGIALGLRSLVFLCDGERIGGGFSTDELSEVEDMDEDFYVAMADDSDDII